MNDRLAPDLRKQLERLAQSQPRLELPFLVTMAPGQAWRSVVPFEPTLEVELTRLVAGAMTAAQALALAQNGAVERIEFDGEAQALQRLLADLGHDRP